MTHCVVIKIGGSLFDLPDLSDRLRRLTEKYHTSRQLLIAGGGAATDIVRTWDRCHQLGEETSHWLALRSMQLTGGLLRTILLPDADDCRTTAGVDALRSLPGLSVLDMHDILLDAESRDEDSVPHSWQVTSDSIAAWVGQRWTANELILVKSVARPCVSLAAAVETGLVDAFFPRLARTLPRISWCNLRDDSPTIQPWLVAGRQEFDAAET
ncbi:MAG: uridylate kinase [Planctomycetota bacterium]|nr:uridylate kinase [Planctomycetota bacterium]